jgi:polynucleotide kinase-phosphatase
MEIRIPELALVALVGPSGCGKSTFAKQHFLPTEVISSDHARALVCDNPDDQTVTPDAFDIVYYIAAKRLAAGKLTVIDATNVHTDARKPIVSLAKKHHVLPVAIVFDLPRRLYLERNAKRERVVPEAVIKQQADNLHRSIHKLRDEGFRHVFVLRTEEDVANATLTRTPLWTNRKQEHGPFDIIGDVHGCYDELETLLKSLGYEFKPVENGNGSPFSVSHPEGRKALFLGDLCDRGPKTPEVFKLAMGMVKSGNALMVPGNHDVKLMKKINGRNVSITHGLAESLDQLSRETPEFSREIAEFVDSLVSHLVLDDGRLVVAHAGMKQSFQGRSSATVRDFALYGETTGETDEYGLPVRYNWASEYRGQATVVYGHTPVPEAEWLNNTLCVDTGCVYGGKLTALRYPERQIVSVPAARMYCEPKRPLLPDGSTNGDVRSAQQLADDMLDLDDVIGKRLVETRLYGKVQVREENAIAALEVMSRFAADPRWLVYLPPTMSPCETAVEDGFLEYPSEAFRYFRNQGVTEVICEEKHMGSRAVIALCRDTASAQARFGTTDDRSGIILTRTGRRFFEDRVTEDALLGIVRAAMDTSGFWETFNTNWALFDCELMPWSAKAKSLIQEQYAAVGIASRTALAEAVAQLSTTAARTPEVQALLENFTARESRAQAFSEAYRRYCWEVNAVTDYKIAPFHLLATEGAAYFEKPHPWHLERIAELCAADESGVLFQTAWKRVVLDDDEAVKEATDWWLEMTGRGGEGMVVKPLDFTVRGERGLVQPAVKCRGREYLRIIYGPEYDAPEHLARLRSRGLGGKRRLALKEFALGVEAVERFVRREPLRRVHECVFGVLAMETEPVDPRL